MLLGSLIIQVLSTVIGTVLEHQSGNHEAMGSTPTAGKSLSTELFSAQIGFHLWPFFSSQPV